LGEADSRSNCLPLPLFGYFLGFFGECTDDADVTIQDKVEKSIYTKHFAFPGIAV